MKYQEIKQIAQKYFPLLSLESIFPFSVRNKIKNILFFITIVFFIFYISSQFDILTILGSENPLFYIINSLAFIFASATFILFCIDAYYYSYYLNDLEGDMEESHFIPDHKGIVTLAKIIKNNNEGDLTRSLLESSVGKEILYRLGIFKAYPFVTQKTFDSVSTQTISVDISKYNIFTGYILSLYDNDKNFSEFLFKNQIQKKDLEGVLNWLVERENNNKRQLRFWSKETLSKNQGIGTDWSYGQIYKLEKYGNRIEEIYDTSQSHLPKIHDKELIQMENILSKSRETNVVLVGDDSILKSDLIIALGKKIRSGKVSGLLKNKIMIVLDTNILVSITANKNAFEMELFSVLDEAVKAGDIILVISDMPSFMMSAKTLGSDVVSLLDPYLSNQNLQVVIMSDTASFHQIIEENIELQERFEKIILPDEDSLGLLEMLLNRADRLEKAYNIIFTYPAIESIAENSIRFFVGQIVLDKAIDILTELPISTLQQGKNIVLKSDVLDIFTTKTGVPVGEIKQEEREKLINLEETLHKKIVGQDEAVKAISNAMRRQRSGIESTDRPIGSFLFLGPTGVGKTETTKALAEVFFGSEEKIIRFDMSEYNDSDSLSKLIGSFQTNQSGILSSKLREDPYGVLLLDEFEKANKDVHDLFLQILDEGIFSDEHGKKINARNLIIVATSNAGSEMIWNITKEGGNLLENKQIIIDSIIQTKTFKPELLNRFDGLIFFHPLENEHVEKISNLMINKLVDRLKEKSIDLVVNNDLLSFLLKKGTDPKFGARPINRAIQDSVEKLIAEKIINGEIKPGDKVTLSKEELDQTL